MSTREELLIGIKTYFESYGLDIETMRLTTHEQVINRVTYAYARMLAEKDKEARGLKRVTPDWYKKFLPPAQQALRNISPLEQEFILKGASGLPSQFAPDSTTINAWDAFERKMSAVSGTLNNLVHMYYWAENASLNLENAQNRLANSQDTYNRAVQRYGHNSWQAIRAQRQMEVSENRLERAQNRHILNYGLLAVQFTMMIKRLNEIIPLQSLFTAGTNLQTAANWKQVASQIALALTNPLTLAMLAMGGMYLLAKYQRGRPMTHQPSSDWMGGFDEERYPTAQRGAQITRGGLINVERDELILNPNQQRSLGSTFIIQLGDIVIGASDDLDGALDSAFDRQKWAVKSQLRSFIR